MTKATKGTPPKRMNANNGSVSKTSTPKDVSNTKDVSSAVESDISYDLSENCYSKLPSNPTVKQLQAYFEEKLKNVEISCNARVDTLLKVVEQKDTVIGKLNMEIGELKKSFNFISKETSDMKLTIENNEKSINTEMKITHQSINEVKHKTVDLEDQSRRSNLIFYNFPECEQGEKEDCEQLVHNLINARKFFDPREETVWIDRAHRLGPFKPHNKDRPRPIIAKFAYYKQKIEIIKMGIC